MTILEFEQFVSDNYAELKKMARVIGARGLDYLHDMVEAVCDGRAKPPPMPLQSAKVGLLWLHLVNDRTNDDNASRLRRAGDARFLAEYEALGDDVFTDTIRKNKAARARRANLKKAGRSPSSAYRVAEAGGTLPSDWLTGQAGDTRWVYQRRRDARLYDGQALQSLAEHIRGRSSRSLRGAGRSYVCWGREVAMDPRVLAAWRNGEVKGFFEGGWTQISCSTGYQFHGKKWIGQDSPGTFAQCGGCGEHAISGRHDKACALKGAAA